MQEMLEITVLVPQILVNINYRIVSNKRSPSNKRPLTYFQIKLGKMPKFLNGVSLQISLHTAFLH